MEDQYVWGHEVGRAFTEALRTNLDLHVIAVVPIHPNKTGALNRIPQDVGRHRAMTEMLEAAPGRVAFYGPENRTGTPVYVHAKTCVVDDTWMTIGSDNFNRRSWTHDSELTAAVVDPSGALPRRLRVRLAAEHLDRDHDDPDDVADLHDPTSAWAAFGASAARLDAWHAGGRRGPRPAGRLRRLAPPDLGRAARLWARLPYLTLLDPDGRPAPLRSRDTF